MKVGLKVVTQLSSQLFTKVESRGTAFYMQLYDHHKDGMVKSKVRAQRIE